MINIIVAIGMNNEIGCGNKLLAHIPEDLKYFKEKTKGHIMIMGRKTLESLPNGPLKGRENIVISKSTLDIPNIYIANNIEDSLRIADTINKEYSNNKEIFIIGGASIYSQFIEKADKLYITHMFKEFEADTYFPEIDKNIWEVESITSGIENIQHEIPHIFVVYKRK